MSQHLISTRKRYVRCAEKSCRKGIFFGYDGGMSVYVNADPITPLEEIVFRLQGKMTFVSIHGFLAMRSTFNVHTQASIYVEHEHRNGFHECPIPTSKKATDSNEPCF